MVTRVYTFTVERPVDEVRASIDSWLASHADRILGVSDSEARPGTQEARYIEAKTGTEVGRRLRGSEHELLRKVPGAIGVRCQGTDYGTLVQLRASDLVRFGLKFRMRQKYERAIKSTIEDLRAALGG